MTLDKSQELPSEPSKRNLNTCSLEEWSSECYRKSNQLHELLPLARPEIDGKNWRAKLHLVFTHLLPNANFTLFASQLNVEQILEIIHFVQTARDYPSYRQKLSQLFTEISPLVFRKIIHKASDEELHFFKEEALTEVIQHHVSLLIIQIQKEFLEFCQILSKKEEFIAQMDFNLMDQKEIQDLMDSIKSFQNEAKALLELANRILTITWNTNRIDLISEIGTIKESCQRALVEIIGTIETTGEELSSGIWETLRKRINHLFSDKDCNGNLNLMKDSTPALEALIKFSIWNIQDYFEVGLLPFKNSPLSFPFTDQEKESLKHREQLFLDAENHLNQIGLKTLLDLKKAQIYSKKALKQYINALV